MSTHKDFSKEILSKFFNKKDSLLHIVLHNGTQLEGILVGFFHGDENGLDKPYIKSWHFLTKDEIEKYREDVSIEGGSQYGRIIEQKDIKSITFK